MPAVPFPNPDPYNHCTGCVYDGDGRYRFAFDSPINNVGDTESSDFTFLGGTPTPQTGNNVSKTATNAVSVDVGGTVLAAATSYDMGASGPLIAFDNAKELDPDEFTGPVS